MRAPLCSLATIAVVNVMAPARPSVVSKVQDVGLKDAPLKSLFPSEMPPPTPVSDGLCPAKAWVLVGF